MKNINLVISLILLSSCSGTGIKKVTIEESNTHPSWVDDEKLSWEKNDRIYFKTKETIRGDQRVNGCYVLAAHDNRENLIRGITDQMRGSSDEAQTSIEENAEIVLGKVRAGEWNGKIYGLREESQFFQRYQIRDELTKEVTERIDCYSLSSIGKGDYARTRNELMNKIAAVDPRIKEAIAKKQIEFFHKEPASVKEDPKPEVKPTEKSEAKTDVKSESTTVAEEE